MKQALYDFYNSLFEGIVANVEELKHECYKLRYQVYCDEHEWLRTSNPYMAEKLECDEYDQHSVHVLLRLRQTGEYVGTARLILHPPEEKMGVFPIHALCRENNIVLPEFFPLPRIAEVSRFCIVKDFRRRALDTIATAFYSPEELEADRQRILPSMSLGLLAMLTMLIRCNGIEMVCAEMEPFLMQLLGKLGIHWISVGPLIEFHGKRQVSYLVIEDYLRQCRAERPDVWDVVTDKGRYLDNQRKNGLVCAPNGSGFELSDEEAFAAACKI